MTELVSTIKPQGVDYEEKPVIDDKLYWSSRVKTKKAFADNGFSYEEYLDGNPASPIRPNHGNVLFFTKVDISKEPITQTISTMHRQRALEYYKDKTTQKEKSRIKEYLTYNVRISGVDWLGNPLRANLEFEGKCNEPVKRIKIKADENGRQHAEYHMSGLRYKFYIPFTMKAVDDILEKTGTDKDTVIYYGKFGGTAGSSTANMLPGYRCNEYTYEQFVNTDWKDFEELSKKVGGPTGKSKWTDEKQKKVFVE